MIAALAVALLVLTSLGGLALVPLGLPGLWVMVAGVAGYGWLTGFQGVTAGVIGLAAGLALLGELVETWVGFRFAKRYGASSRAGWGALVGGVVGAVVGVPVPVIGSVLGGFAGSFVGAAVFEYTRARRGDVALGAGWGAVLGRAGAAAGKIALGIVIVVVAAFSAMQG